MNGAQRWSYLSGAVQWYGDLLAVVFFLFLLLGAANVALGGGLLFRKLSGFLLAAIPLLAVLGLVRAVALLRRGTGASWRDALGAVMIWQSTSIVVARASVQGLFAKEAEFLRTPKTAENARWWDAVRGNLPESLFALLGIAGIVGSATAGGFGGYVTAALLLWPTAAFVSAPLNSLGAQRASLPADLVERRRTEFRRFGTHPATVTIAGLAAVGGAVALAAILLAPAGQQVVSPNPVTPARGHHPSPVVHTSGPAPSRSPTSSSSTSSPTSPTSAPTTSPSSASTPTDSSAPTSASTATTSPTASASTP
jgi:hypothetical protein